jgi:2-(1,2-epoxy-1,2-dihydrophenyl)acetyl-CoA isomerase
VGLLVEPSETVLTLTINRPRRKNAMDTETWQRLLGTLGRTALDESVRSVVLTGAAGDFCAGADLANRRGDVHPLTDMRMINAVAAALHDLPQPVVAKVRGVAAGAGCNLALGCDLVVADTTARFSQIFAKRGLSLDFGGSWLLPRLVGLQQSKRLAFLAGTIGAEEARELGMVTWVKEPEELDGFVADLTEQLAKTAPVALAHSKALLHQAVSLTFRESLEGEARAQLINFGTDGPAARRAFLEKSEPVFEGKWQL